MTNIQTEVDNSITSFENNIKTIGKKYNDKVEHDKAINLVVETHIEKVINIISPPLSLPRLAEILDKFKFDYTLIGYPGIGWVTIIWRVKSLDVKGFGEFPIKRNY